MNELERRIKSAWQGRVSGCMLGKAVEALSAMSGRDELHAYLNKANALPLRDYVPLIDDAPDLILGKTCKGQFGTASSPDDDINYSVLALELLETHGRDLTTEDVARAWIMRLPAGMTFTAERAAYRTLVHEGSEWFGLAKIPPGFDLARCSDNEFNDWIGAQIRADVYGWVTPGNPDLAAALARTDASLSHRGDGVHGAVLVAAWGAAIPAAENVSRALDRASTLIPPDSRAARAIALGRQLAESGQGALAIHERYGDLSPVHTLNNLALVVWALLSHPDDFAAAIGEVVAAGCDTDCNGATVGALWGLQGKPIPEHWTAPWHGRVGVSLAGTGEFELDDLVSRTVAVARSFARFGDSI